MSNITIKDSKTWKLYHSNSIAVHFCTYRYLIIGKDISHISHNTVILLWMHHCMKSLRGSMRFVDFEYKNFFQKIFIAKLQTFTAYVKYNPSFPYILVFTPLTSFLLYAQMRFYGDIILIYVASNLHICINDIKFFL